MAKIWAKRLEAGTQIFSECPDKYKNDVLKILQADVANGKITEEQYQEIISK